MDTIQIQIVGVCPMLMHSDRGMNDLFDPLAREFKAIAGKRKKTDEDRIQLGRVEWELGMYFDEEIGPYIPAHMIEASIRDGAKSERRGKDVTKAVQVIEDRVPLQYRGPRTVEALWSAGQFCDVRTVKNQKNKVIRSRPKFSDWSLECSLAYDPAVLNRDELIRCVELAGRYNGIGDFRPRFGRFTVEAR